MILGDPASPTIAAPQGQRRASLDEVFHRIAQRQPDVLALIDAPNRTAFTDGTPRRLTYAQADRAIAAIAARLTGMGLNADAIVGIQLPNTVESILTILGVMRAGMIAAPLPLLWRRADAVAALGRIGAKAMITCGRADGFSHCQLAMRIASELFSIRYVCAFGSKLPDGVVPFDELLTAGLREPPPLDRDRLNNAAAHVGLITFEVGNSGIVPVARNHLEMIAGGLGATLESRLTQGARILSTMPASSFAGVSLMLLPWLLSAGTLCLHHRYDADVFAQQRRDEACQMLVMPGALALHLAQAGAFAHDDRGAIIGAWRSPERLHDSPVWPASNTILVDVPIFGEVGLLAGRRGADGRPAPIAPGPVTAPRDGSGGVMVGEIVATAAGTVGLRGPMVPRHAFPPGIERSGLPHVEIDQTGLVDTGYACRAEDGGKCLIVTGAPAGMISVGGYRLPLHELQEAIGRIDSGATLTALPDPVLGQRLVGNSANREVVRAALAAVGVNPIVTAAFRARGEQSEAALEEPPLTALRAARSR
jgi:AMP-binding enzyme